MAKRKPKALYFDSMVEMAKYIDATPREPDAGNVSEQTSRGSEWTDMSYTDAMKLAHNGGYWKEGAERMVAGVADAAALRENFQQPVISNDVAGFAPDVPAYLAGVPDCMMAMQEGDMSTAQLPVVTIGVGTYASGVSSEAVFNRGVAILSLIDAVEAIGYRVQLDYVGDNCDGGNDNQIIRTTLKRSQDTWNPGSVAFALANSAMLRRLEFALIERDPATVKRSQFGYGRGDDGYLEEYGLAFEYMRSNHGFRSLSESLRTVERMAADFGMDVKLIEESA